MTRPDPTDPAPEERHETAGQGRVSAMLNDIAVLPGERISLGALVETMGDDSFTPLILFAALIVISPLSGIPGLPTLFAVLLLLITGQMLAGRHHLWLPERLRRRSLPADRLRRAIAWLQRPGRWLDRWLRTRLTVLTDDPLGRLPALLIFVTGLGIPLLEVFPFATSFISAGIAVLAAGMFARDGLVLMAGYAIYGLWIMGAITVVGFFD